MNRVFVLSRRKKGYGGQEDSSGVHVVLAAWFQVEEERK